MKDAERKAFELKARAVMDDILRWQRTVQGGYPVDRSAVDIITSALVEARDGGLEEAAKECKDYAHSGISMMRRQVAYACERRIRALMSGAGEEGR